LRWLIRGRNRSLPLLTIAPDPMARGARARGARRLAIKGADAAVAERRGISLPLATPEQYVDMLDAAKGER
jgi:hypothetical protein